jgi:hypothetical protein
VLGRDSLDGEGDDLLGLALRVPTGALADLAQLVGGVRMRLLLEPANELRLRVLCGHSRELFEALPLLGDELLQLRLAIGDDLFFSAELARATAEFLVTLLQHVELSVERRLTLPDALFLLLDFGPAPPNFALERLAKFDELLFTGDDGALAERLRFPLGVCDDSLGGLLGCRLGPRLTLMLARDPSPSS